MREPTRIQLSRRRGWKMPPNTKKVDRSTRWGNPFNETQIAVCYPHRGYPMPLVGLHEPPSLGRCIDMFQAYLYARLQSEPDFLEPLRGKNLACWCPLDAKCHADILLRLANEWLPSETTSLTNH